MLEACTSFFRKPTRILVIGLLGLHIIGGNLKHSQLFDVDLYYTSPNFFKAIKYFMRGFVQLIVAMGIK